MIPTTIKLLVPLQLLTCQLIWLALHHIGMTNPALMNAHQLVSATGINKLMHQHQLVLTQQLLLIHAS
jgi:hypothetical protein